MIIKNKQLLNLTLVFIMFLIILIFLLVIGLQVTIFNAKNGQIIMFEQIFCGFKTNNANSFAFFKLLNSGDINNLQQGIYGSTISIIVFMTVALVVTMAMVFTNNNKVLNIIGDITLKITLLITSILFLVVLLQLQRVLGTITILQNIDNNSLFICYISPVTWAIFIVFTIIMPLVVIAITSINNRTYYQNLKSDFSK